MSVRIALEISLAALILCGAAALSLALANPLPFLVLALVTFHQSYRSWKPVSEGRWLTVSGLGLLLFTLVLVASGTDLLVTLGYLLVGFQIVRIYQGWKVGGIWRLMLLGFMQLVVSAARSAESTFIIPYLGFVASAVCVLSLLRLQVDAPGEGVRVGLRYLLRAGVTTAIVLLVVSLVFVSAPRVGGGWIGHTSGHALTMIGFGDRVDLAAMGDILDNPEVVMQVFTIRQVTGPAGLWRGRVFDRYDGEEWIAAPLRLSPWRGKHGTGFTREGVASRSRTTVSQRFFLRPIGGKVLFAPIGVHQVWFERGGPPELISDEGDVISMPAARRTTVEYHVVAYIPETGDDAEVTEEESGGVDPRWLHLSPDALNISRIRSLAEKIVDDAGARTPVEKARAVETYLQEGGGFGYSLRRAEIHPEARERVEDFLFYRKAGHCEYFASSMVILLRTLGIPARLVNGFKAAEWSPVGDFYTVRQRHAHAWAEVYLGETVGWLPMDPTPSGLLPAFGDAFASLESLVQYLRYLWVTRVVTFNIQDQIGFVRSLQDSLTSIIELLGEIFWRVGTLIPISLAAAVLALQGLRRRRQMMGPKVPEARHRFYRDLLRILRRRGLRRRIDETPRQFAGRVLQRGGEAWGPVIPITETYYRVRFGGVSLSREESESVEGEVRALRRRKLPRPTGRSATSAAPRPHRGGPGGDRP